MNIEIMFIFLTLIFYLFSFIFSFFKNKVIYKFIFKIGFVFHIILLIMRTIYSKHAPFVDIFESINFFSFCIVLTLFIQKNLLNFLNIILIFVILFFSLSLFFYRTSSALPDALKNFWFYIHIPSCFLSYGFFTTAFITSIQLLFSKKEQEELYFNLSYESVKYAFPLLTIGILSGSLWAKNAWGSYWNWDPKETSSIILWFIYLLFFHLSNRKGWKNKKIALILIFGFLILIFTFLGLNFLKIVSLHSY